MADKYSIQKLKPAIILISISLISISFSILIALYAENYYYVYTTYESDFYFLITAACLTIIFFTAATLYFFRTPEEAPTLKLTSVETIDHQINNLSRQKFLLACVSIALGVYAIYVATRGIEVAKSTVPSREAYSLDKTISLANRQLEQLLDTVPTIDGNTQEFQLKRLEKTEKILSEIEIQQTERNRILNQIESGSISGTFLFEFFSNILVRIGTIAITLTLWGFCFGLYRRCDIRINELKSTLLALKLVESRTELEQFKIARDAVIIIDEPKKLTATSVENVLSNHVAKQHEQFFQTFPEFLKNISQFIRLDDDKKSSSKQEP